MHAKHLALVVVSLAACAPAPTPHVGGPQPTPFPPRPGAVVDLDTDALIASLSVRDKIAQLVMPWIPGTYAAYDEEAFERMEGWVESLHVGGLIVSVGSPLDIAAKINRLQQRSLLPLLVASD
ncbi:MAG: hypothetical protein ACREMX_05620, partial [Gemmatimonadales bacterium]